MYMPNNKERELGFNFHWLSDVRLGDDERLLTNYCHFALQNRLSPQKYQKTALKLMAN